MYILHDENEITDPTIEHERSSMAKLGKQTKDSKHEV